MKCLFRFFSNRVLSIVFSVSTLLGLIFLFNQTGIAGQGATPWIKTEQTSIRLLTNVSAIGNSQNIQLGLQFKLEPGWKIYWRSPGDAGYPPRLNWERSENLKKINFMWPLPTRFSISGIQTIGYKKEVVFPINATINDLNEELILRADLDYLACNEICIPYNAKLSLTIPSGQSNSLLPGNNYLINQYIKKIPANGNIHKLKIIKAETSGAFIKNKENIRKGFVTVKTESDVPFTKPDMFVEGSELIFFETPKIVLNKNKTTATFIIPFVEEENAKIINSNVRLTLKDGERSVDQSLQVKFANDAPNIVEQLSLSLVFGFALLGGLILNLMPCVLPVISLKILSIVSYSSLSKREVRLSFIASALGIIFSFLVIGVALTSAKFAGSAVGWGIQFQHPWFITGLSIIVAFFAYNLWGLFEVRLPNSINNLVHNFSNNINNAHGFASNFITGAFATILATPCSAPFLGTAVGFALAGSIVDIFTVFLALGTGMALPYLIIATFPSFTNNLPKPGVWMVTVKKTLSIALVVTVIWLLSILAIQVGLKITLIISALLMLIGLILIIRTHKIHSYRKLTTGMIIACILGVFWAPYNISMSPSRVSTPKEPYWQNFDPEAIPKLVKEGKTVFVDITAEWCITCKVNKATVLGRQEFKDLATSKQIITMQGDWTKPNESILNYLKTFSRFGIPFNAVYGPGSTLGDVLPELLTQDTVLNRLQKASNGKLVF